MSETRQERRTREKKQRREKANRRATAMSKGGTVVHPLGQLVLKRKKA